MPDLLRRRPPTLADRDLQRAREAAHAAFDPLWRSGRMTRQAAYEWLAWRLGLDLADCHIGRFGEGLCRRVAEVAGEMVEGEGR